MTGIIEEMHETMRDMHEVGVIDKQVLRDFEMECLPPAPYTADAIKGLRERFHLSQAVFASYINASVSTVQKWERGEKKPTGAALRLLSAIDRRGLEVLSDLP